MRTCVRTLLPLRAEHAEVGFVTPLSIFLSGDEEFVGLFRELLCYGSETNLTLQVVLELIPLRLFGVVCCAVGGSAVLSLSFVPTSDAGSRCSLRATSVSAFLSLRGI